MSDNTRWNIPEDASLNALHDIPDIDIQAPYSLEEINRRFRVDLTKPIEPPKWVISINEPDGSKRRFGTLGNFSTIQGKAKSRKSTLTTALMAASIVGNGLSVFATDLPDDKKTVLLFDTEQDDYDVQTTGNRVLRMIGRADSPPDNFDVYWFRQASTKERLRYIESVLYQRTGVGVVIIDGIRDLLGDFNDLKECAEIIDALLRWTAELKIHIIAVIHTNKGDSNARGHLGSELMNKAETAVSVTRDTNNELVSYVKPEYTRGREFTPFAFRFGDTGLPEIVTGWTPASKAGRFSKPEPQLYEMEMKLTKIFGSDAAAGLSFAEIKTRLQTAFRDVYEIGEKKAEKLIRVLVEEQLIRITGTPRTRQCKYHPMDGTEPDQIPK
jgi:hypothetical protein